MYVQIEFSVPTERIAQFKELGKSLEKSVPEVIELCMYEKLEELLDEAKNNVPENPIDLKQDLLYTFNSHVKKSN